MRKYAVLKEPIKCNNRDSIYKIMLHQTKNEVFPYQYCSIDAFLPIRVKGRNTGRTQWGQLEILKKRTVGRL